MANRLADALEGTDADRGRGAGNTTPGRGGRNETLHPLEEEKFEVIIPKELQTPEAKKVLSKLQKKGYLDEDWQPSTLVGWQKGTLAHELGQRFGIRYVWVEMAKMWKCNPKTLRQYHSKEFTEQKVIDFSKKIKTIIY